MKPTELTVELVRQVDESYPIIVGRGLEDKVVEVASRPGLAHRRIALITDSTVVDLVADQLVSAFEAAGRGVDVVAGVAIRIRGVRDRICNTRGLKILFFHSFITGVVIVRATAVSVIFWGFVSHLSFLLSRYASMNRTSAALR